MCIRFTKIDGFIRVYDGTRYLVLFGSERYNAIYDRIDYLINKKSDVEYIINHNFARIRIDSYKTFYNIIILIKSVDNTNKYNSTF